jgi:hypothetical protein
MFCFPGVISLQYIITIFRRAESHSAAFENVGTLVDIGRSGSAVCAGISQPASAQVLSQPSLADVAAQRSDSEKV